MLSAVRNAATGGAVLSPKITRRLLAQFTAPASGRQAEAGARLDALTGKEREVLLAIAHGLTNTEIADELHISEATAKTHISRILSKLALTNRVQAAYLAYQAGLLD